MTTSFLSVGFRPFYLGASVVAALAIPIWTLAFLSGASDLFSGGVPVPTAPTAPAAPSMSPFDWHAHEMIFGFAPAVIVGFLLTAARNWTGLPTPSGAALAALFGLWVAGRILLLLGGVTGAGLIGVWVDLAFLPVAAVTLAVPLWQSANRRNAFVVVVLLMLAISNGLFHASHQGWITGLPTGLATTVALDFILILMVVIGGRIIPAFSSNAVAALQPRSWLGVEVLAIGLTVFIAFTDMARILQDGQWRSLQTQLLMLCALAHLVRLFGWQPWKTWRNPMLLVLPLAYCWIPIHLLLRIDHSTLATHALTTGAMAGLMLAMMTRSALGHTGRPLKAGPWELICFASIHLAAVTRVFGPLLLPEFYQTWIHLSAFLWTLAFGVFLLAYWPILTRPPLAESIG